MRAALALALVVLAGCPSLTRHSARNAPGNVELDTPYRPERGDPAAYQEAEDPGMNALGVAPGIGFMGGVGRSETSEGSLEVTAQVHLAFGEHVRSPGRDALGYPWTSWGATLGWAALQTDGSGRYNPGPLYAELTRQWFMIVASVGAAVYATPDDGGVDVGFQGTLVFAALGVRMRYMQDTGFEVFGGYQLHLPTSITWSK